MTHSSVRLTSPPNALLDTEILLPDTSLWTMHNMLSYGWESAMHMAIHTLCIAVVYSVLRVSPMSLNV